MRQITLPNWLLRMDKDFKWFSIPKLPMLLALLQVFGFILVMNKPDFASRLILDPNAVLHGEVWRVFTFLAIPLANSFFVFFVVAFFYYVMTTLENAWGSTLLTVYFLVSWASTVCSALLTGKPVETFAYMEFSFFFALATINPNHTIYLFFILPIAFKWIALFIAVVLLFVPLFLGSSSQQIYILFLFVNYIIFFGKDYWIRLKTELARRKQGV